MTEPILNYIFLTKNIMLSRDELDRLRFNLLKKQLLYVYQKIPFYKTAFDNADVNPLNFKSLENLAAYPIITKDVIRLNSSKFLNQNLSGKIFKSHTSGSTGQPMWTYYDFKSWIRKKYIIKARARIECGLKPFDKIVIFESASQNSLSKRNFFFRNIKSHFKVFSIFESHENTIKKLIKFSPAAIYGSPSYFFQLGKFIADKNIKLPSIKFIFTSSEYIQENVRSYIQKIFNSEVFDIYGSTEFKEAAWECEKHEGYHINEDEVFIEILKDGKPVKPGTAGNIVMTDLRNKAMPLIRFQMYDKGVMIEEKCSCGRTFSLMKPHAGRSSEYIFLSNGQILSPYLFTTNIEKINGLLQYQIIQISKEKLLVNVVTNSENFNNIAAQIKSILNDITNALMEIDIELKNKIDIEENGKFKVVKNLLVEQNK